MSNFNFTFSNTGNEINNDVVFPGSPFQLKGHSYLFTIKPKTNFWRFGIRLSETEKIEFYHPKHRYKDPEYKKFKDVHIGVGEWKDGKWIIPKRLHLAQYNFGSFNHILERLDSYIELSAVHLKISLFQKNELSVSFITESDQSFTKILPFDGNYMYFKAFAWADSTDFEIDVSFEIESLLEDDENKSAPFQVGKIIFRLGDMFDYTATMNSNVTILPASSKGTLSPNIRTRALELNIPYPAKNSPGTVSLYPEKEGMLAGYAYSVDDTLSNSQIISNLCKSLLKTISTQPAFNEHLIKGINLPLLGTGAGQLEPTDVASIYDIEFNQENLLIHFIVSIENENVFQPIKYFFKGRYNMVSKSFINAIPNAILDIEKETNIIFEASAFEVDHYGEIIGLDLSYKKITDFTFLLKLSKLRKLGLNGFSGEAPSFLEKLNNLQSLYLGKSSIQDHSFISKLIHLRILDLSFNSIYEISFLSNLKNLASLVLRDNKLNDINDLSKLNQLEFLDLSSNQINDIRPLCNLNKLTNLNVSNNEIVEINCIIHLANLNYLDISKNKIEVMSSLLSLHNLEFLIAELNPLIESSKLILGESENQLAPIKNFILRQAESEKIEFTLPAKVLLLGNHASGKSSLLSYVQNGKLLANIPSTHIIRIEKYPISGTGIPTAIFFDFGGQDYYHGVYRAFLSAGSIYLILWNSDQNENNQRKDVHNIITQDFSVDYWLNQKTYLERGKLSEPADPTLLIQTHSDRTKRLAYLNYDKNHIIENEFYISLLADTVKIGNNKQKGKVNMQALKYLRQSILSIIENKKLTRREPVWYIEFIKYILSQNSEDTYESRSLKDILQYYLRTEPNKIDLLKEDLDQLNKQGLILYYKHVLPDIVWLNPSALAEYVHKDILGKESLTKFKGRIPVINFKPYNKDVINLLQLQKVIFLHEQGEQGTEYIIPNYLPLANENKSHFDLLTFGIGNPLFNLKFEKFIPFGLINQLICFFGKLPDKKAFWRDQLLFTLNDKAKILIHVNFQVLEITVFGSFEKGSSEQENDIIKYLFYGIIGLYYDFELLEFNEYLSFQKKVINKDDFLPQDKMYQKLLNSENIYESIECRPSDLYISIDENHFINYQKLCDSQESVGIYSKKIDDERMLSETSALIDIYPFQAFTIRQLKRRKKAVISYSKQDLAYINKFKQYLVPLYENDLLENPWYCTNLIAGDEWDEIIRKKFHEADIIFFMISENLMSTKYVNDIEIKMAIDKYDKDKSIKIIPILLVPYNYSRANPYNLTRFTALPFTQKAVTEFPNQHLAWYTISESLKIMLENDLFPETNDDKLNNRLKKIYEGIVGGS